MRRQIAAATALTALALLAIAAGAGAGATYDPLGAGTTKLTLDKRFVSFLKADGITLGALRRRQGQGQGAHCSGAVER
jgi:hypothetical protein